MVEEKHQYSDEIAKGKFDTTSADAHHVHQYGSKYRTAGTDGQGHRQQDHP